MIRVNVIGIYPCAEYIALYVVGVSSLNNTFGGTYCIFISVTIVTCQR